MHLEFKYGLITGGEEFFFSWLFTIKMTVSCSFIFYNHYHTQKVLEKKFHRWCDNVLFLPSERDEKISVLKEILLKLRFRFWEIIPNIINSYRGKALPVWGLCNIWREKEEQGQKGGGLIAAAVGFMCITQNRLSFHHTKDYKSVIFWHGNS